MKAADCPEQIAVLAGILAVGLALMVIVCAVAGNVPQALIRLRFNEYVPELLNRIVGVVDCAEVPDINR